MGVPQNFLLIDGRVYEMQGMSLGYMPIRKFIEGEYNDEKQVYRTFDIPWAFPDWVLPFKYAINESRRFYSKEIRKEIVKYLEEGGSIYKYFPDVADFLETTHNKIVVKS